MYLSKSKTGTSGSRRDSVDSLEINKSGVDLMTSSMDSLELMKEGITAKSSRSDADSIEQVVPAAVKSDSTDSIEQQQAGSNRFSQQYEEDSIEEDTHVTQTTVMSSSGQHQMTTTTTTTTVTRTGGPQSFGAIPFHRFQTIRRCFHEIRRKTLIFNLIQFVLQN
uniref:Uncharacterized protein n=1 Tax=Phlebotomus papatasi TaxID=29031 RepID=A0A1B0D7T6_PHLPP